MSIAPSAIPFQTDEDPIRNQGSTASSLDVAPSPSGPTIWSPGISTPSTWIGPGSLPRRPRAAPRAAAAGAAAWARRPRPPGPGGRRAGDLDAVDLDRPGLVAAQPQRVPQRRLRLDV